MRVCVVASGHAVSAWLSHVIPRVYEVSTGHSVSAWLPHVILSVEVYVVP